VVVTYCVFDPRKKKHIVHAEPPLDMIRTGDREEEIQVNMRRVLDVLEDIIRSWSEQWQMLVPVWPELLET
jgi:lauroyl/myristoyl acyltransferase